MNNVDNVSGTTDGKFDENHNNAAEVNVRSDRSAAVECHDVSTILATQSNESPDQNGSSSFEVLLNSGFDATESASLSGNAPEDQLTVMKRLGQIKEYKKQVLTTMNQLKGEGPDVDKDILRKLIDSYDNFKRQEEQYLEVLQNILVSKQKLALTVLDENSNDNQLVDQLDVSEASNDQDPPLINPQMLQTMIKQQEDLRALHGHIVASQSHQHQNVERSSNSRSEQDLLAAQKSVENQAASLAAKRKLLEDLKARLSHYSDLSSRTALEAELVEDELGQRNVVDNKLQILGEKKRLMDQILTVLNEPGVEQNETNALDALKVVEESRSEPIEETPQNVKSVLEKKYNELLATKKRIAEIRSMMTTLEANCGDISNERDEIPGPSRSSKMNNMVPKASKNLPEQQFDPLEERKNLSQVKRQLLALDDDQLSKLTDGVGCQTPSNDLEEIEETQFPNGRRMNSIKNNLTDYLPCRISKPVRIQQNVRAAPKQQNVEIEDATECDDYEEEEEDDDEEENSKLMNIHQQKSDKNRIFRRNNVVQSPLNNSRRIVESSRNEHVSRKIMANTARNGVTATQQQNNTEGLQGPMSSSTDSRYDQLSQHIESIRSIFDSLITNQHADQTQHQIMTSSFPPPARQNSSGVNENLMSQSMISVGPATNVLPQMQQQNQELMLSLIKCQQQLFAEHCELQRLSEMYKELANKVNNENGLGQNAIDSRPLSTSSLYNLLAPNPYLHGSYKQQQSLSNQQLPFYPRSTNQSFNTVYSRQSRNEESSFPKRSSSTKLRRSSYLNERSNQSSFLNGRMPKNRGFSPAAAGYRSNNGARVNDDSRNNLDFEDGPFDSLRESIYSEVATLISQNEQRPHYLLELFKELQLLSSDQLRERAFSAIHDILDRYLVDENEASTNSIWSRANKRQSDFEKSKTAKTKAAADSSKIYTNERDATDNLSTELEIVDNLNDISPDSNLENDEITFCPEMETRMSKIERELTLFLSQPSTNIKCDGKFLDFLRKFALALLVSYNFLPPRDPTTKFFRKKLNESLQECLTRFINAKLSDCRQEICLSLVEIIKNQLSFYFLVQNVDSALDGPNNEKVESNTHERPEIQKRIATDPKVPHKHTVSNSNVVEQNIRSPSEFSEILQYREEFQTVDDALAYIDDEFKTLDNEEQTSIRSCVESRNAAEVEKCIATTSKI